MTFEEILEITRNRIDETYEDAQVDNIIKNAINHAYLFDLSKIDPVFKTIEVTIQDGKAILPDDLRTIESIGREYKKGEYRKGKTFFSPSNNEKIKITYSSVPERLSNNEDVPTISEDLQYLLSTKGCEVYFQHRKKNNLAIMYKDEYDQGKMEYQLLNDEPEEAVIDYYGGE